MQVTHSIIPLPFQDTWTAVPPSDWDVPGGTPRILVSRTVNRHSGCSKRMVWWNPRRQRRRIEDRQHRCTAASDHLREGDRRQVEAFRRQRLQVFALDRHRYPDGLLSPGDGALFLFFARCQQQLVEVLQIAGAGNGTR